MAWLARYRRSFLKEAVIGFGFLSGLWAHLGFDPGNLISDFLRNILLQVDPAHEQIITVLFTYGPLVLTVFAVLLIYRRAGLWGYVATGLAYLAGLWLNLLSIPLLIAAVIVGYFAARR